MKYDAVVIGAGHNGLVAAARLGQSGLKVLALERNSRIGGLCMPFEIIPGYTCPGLLADTSCFRASTAESLQLGKYGLQFDADPLPTLNIGGDSTLLLGRNPSNERLQVAAYSNVEGESFAKWTEFIRSVQPAVCGLLDSAPTLLHPAGVGEILEVGLQGLSVRRLGKETMFELLRVFPMSCSDWLGENFKDPLLKQALAGPAVFGSFVGPFGAGTAANLLFHRCTSGKPVKGGPRALLDALGKACESCSVELRKDSTVRSIRIQDGRVRGVTLESSETIESEIVLSSCHPVETLLGMVDPGILPLALEKEIHNYRSRGVLGVLCLALNSPLEFKHHAEGPVEFARIGGGNLEYIEKAFDAVKYSRFSAEPYLDIWMPAFSDKDLAPEGHHVALVLVYCAPWSVEGAWSRRRREELYDAVIRVLSRHVSAVRDRIVGYRLMTPADLEAGFSIRGGHLCHGEHALDQLLFMRPSESTSRYRTPFPGLYLGGSGSHPGGGISGMPGMLAAETILKSR